MGKTGKKTKPRPGLRMLDDADHESSSDVDASELNGHVDLNISSSDDDNESEENEDSETASETGSDGGTEDEDEGSESEDEEEHEASIDNAWGRTASNYYAGDTADLEIGQEFDEAKEEEEIARKLQRQKRAAEDDADYIIGGGSSARKRDAKTSGVGGVGVLSRDSSALTESQKLAQLWAESPELKGLIKVASKCLDELSLLGLALDEAHGLQAANVTDSGLAYLELRHHLLLGFVYNFNFYLLLKSEEGTEPSSVGHHPVVERLFEIHKALDRLKPLKKQGRSMVAALVQRAGESVFGQVEEQGGVEDEEENEEEAEEEDEEGEEGEEGEGAKAAGNEGGEQGTDDFDAEEPRALKKVEVSGHDSAKEQRKFDRAAAKALAKAAAAAAERSLGRGGVGDADEPASGAAAGKLQVAYNTMMQKQKMVRGKVAAGGDDDVPLLAAKAKAQKSVVGSAEETRRDHFGASQSDESFSDDGQGAGEGLSKGLDDDDDEDADEFKAFYKDVQAAGQSKSAKRKEKYTVESKPRQVQHIDPDAKRAASYQIIKNRGLVAHKSKIQRNPRVKKREQFRKATIARKGQVREMRDGAEAASYAGEATGIRSNLSRSRAIKN